jgi:hypothetical protein
MLDTLGGTAATGTGAVVRATSPTITTPTISGAITFPDGVRQTFNPDGTNAGLNVGSQAGDPSAPSNGDLWYDSTANELTARINGANVALGAGGGGTQYRTLAWTFSAGGATLEAANSPAIYFPYAGTLTKLTLLADQSGSATVGLWKDTYANYPPTVADVQTTLSLSSAIKNQSGTLSISVDAGDCFIASLTSPATVTWLTVVAEITLS